jgi:hypothetical protein
MNYLINIESNDIVAYDQDYYTLSKNLRTEPWRQATAQEAQPYLVERHILRIKEEAYRRITIVYPITKQLNLIYEQTDKQAEYTSMVEFIANIRVKSNGLESQLSGMSVDELSLFDCSDDQYWQ